MEKYNLNNPTSDKCQIPGLEEIYLKYFGYKENGTYVEVGGYDGISWSNTFGLASIGWNGLIFEPQIDSYVKCLKNYKYFKNVKIINCCVGDYTGKTDFYIGGQLATMKLDIVKDYNNVSWFKGILNENKKTECDIDTLNNLLEQNNIKKDFDLLVVDVEGAELDVLQGIDFKI